MTIAARYLLGNQQKTRISEYLREIGDEEAALRIEGSGVSGQGLGNLWGEDVWGHTGMLVGFIPPESSDGKIAVENAMALSPDESLKDTRIKVTLDKFWVQNYPGRGKHTILCEFKGKNQIHGEAEELRFALTAEANDQSYCGVSSAPVFLGVSVGKNGISFEGSTVNIRSNDDDILLAALDTGPFRDGLTLLTSAQPALKPFVGLASSLVSSVMSRSKNKPVYSFKIGLDFEVSNTSAKLRLGSFVVIQADDPNWSWEAVEWDADSQHLINKRDSLTVKFNYLVFRISNYNE